MEIALIALSIICLALVGALIYMIRIVAAYKVSSNGYEFQASLSNGTKADKKSKIESTL